MSNLDESAGEDDDALHDRPRGDVTPVRLEHVKVARLEVLNIILANSALKAQLLFKMLFNNIATCLEAPRELLELPHRLDALVHVHQRVGERLYRHVQRLHANERNEAVYSEQSRIFDGKR